MDYDDISSGLSIAGRSFPAGTEANATYNAVSPAYFNVLGIPLLRGRFFAQSDSGTSEPVVIVNRAFSKYFPPGSSLVGKRIRMQLRNILRPNAWMTIVGVVADTRDGPAAEPQPEIYLPLSQTNNDWIAALVYAPHGPTNAVRTAITNAFAKADPLAQPPAVRTFSQLMADSASSVRLSAALFTALAIISLVLATAGVFGVVSYSVSQRIAEFGIRMAIGSTPGTVIRTVLRDVAVLLLFGVSGGLVLAGVAGRTLSAQLYGVQPMDIATLAIVTAILSLGALLAGALPAVRAARVDPASALRYE
jgi:putative ABC transport system permease protein